MILHALGAGPAAWDAFTERLGPAYRVHRPQALPRARFEDLRDDLAGYVDGLGLDRFHLLGHSMGGTTAWLYAARHPDRVERMVLVECPVLRPNPDYPVRLLDTVIDPDPEWPLLLNTIRCPTLVVRSERSPLRDSTAELAALIPGARLAGLDGGHHLQVDCQEALLAEVAGFFGGS